MTVVVSDTSPINYLILIGRVGLLPRLFSKIIIPPAVLSELRHPTAPSLVQEWAANPPSWVEVGKVGEIIPHNGLGAGELESIALALQFREAVILLDDGAARQAAQALGLNIRGTIGLLLLAQDKGLLEFPAALEDLRRTNYRINPRLLEQILRRKS